MTTPVASSHTARLAENGLMGLMYSILWQFINLQQELEQLKGLSVLAAALWEATFQRGLLSVAAALYAQNLKCTIQTWKAPGSDSPPCPRPC